MATSMTRRLVTAATALSGLVAGTTLDTGVVKMPAWRRLGAESWARYTREELPTGLVWYPILGIGTVLVNLAATAAVHRDDEVAPAVVRSSRVVGILAVGHLVTDAGAVPHMLKVRETDDLATLDEALLSYTRWHLARTTLDVLTFGANLRSLLSLSKSEPRT